jgi:selenide, water dikinase
MPSPTLPTADIVLLGAGHAHVEVLRRFAMRPEPRIRLTLIAREVHTPYSGMLPGLIRGDYDFDQAHIDLVPLAAAAAVRLIAGEAHGLDLTARTVAVSGRPDIPFDLLSINVGGIPAIPPHAGGIPIKPIGRFLNHLDTLQTNLPEGSRIAIIGGGPAGTELAIALARRFGSRARFVLITADPEPIGQAPTRARSVARATLVDAGVELVCGVAASTLHNRQLALSDGTYVEADAALWATNVLGPPFLAESGLACDPTGCVLVDATLHSLSHHFVFAAGDCAELDRRSLPKAGVWAVSAGMLLAENLVRAATGKPLRPWKPRKEALVIMGLGNGRALAWRNGITLWGGLIWRWKDWIDRRWTQRFALRMTPSSDDAMRCGGCGAKVAADILGATLADLPLAAPDGLLVGLEALDDAAVLRPPAGFAVVQSVDHFRAFIDDPLVFGEIAAAHALSDLYAMGATPWTALAVAAVPYIGSTRMSADLAAMMQGATRVLTANDCTLVGGHSGEALEASLGFAVTGLVDPRRIWRKSGLQPGDALILTKPLGTGVILAGHMRGLTNARWLFAALESMRQTNAAAAHILGRHGITACTDVSGFGLAGHLQEMLTASGMAAVIDQTAVPLLPGAAELAAQGVESTLFPENRRTLPPGNAASPLLADPQTSGGLLAGIPGARAEACLTALRSAGIDAWIIGAVTGPGTDLVIH